MSRDRGLVREVDWLEVFPWLGLVRGMGLAAGPGKLIIALLGLLLTVAGWQAIARGYLSIWDDPDVAVQAGEIQRADAFRQVSEQNATRPTPTDLARGGSHVVPALRGEAWNVASELVEIPAWYLRPFWRVFEQPRFVPASMALACGIWTLAVWAFCGGMITRMAAARFAQDRRVGFFSSARHAISRWMSYVGGPLFPVGAALLLAIFASIVGLIARTEFGFALAGIAWPIGLLCALVCAILLVAALVSWPLMWAAVSTESCDAFDSFNRSFSYATQRPFHLLFYAFLAGAMGTAAWLVAAVIGELTIHLTAWAVSWGSSADRAADIAAASAGATGNFGSRCVAFWSGLVRLLVLAYGHSYFWTASSGIYLLLRRDTDATPLDEFTVDIDEDPFGLPPVRRDGAGVTVLDTSRERETAATR